MYETRKRMIFDVLLRQETITVTELSRILSVSDMTVRRDIRSMEKEGLLRQVHGGAVRVQKNEAEEPFSARRVEQQERKQAIAREALAWSRDNESFYIDGSTTCSELSRLLKGRGRHTVVTDSLSVLNELGGCPGIELVLLGGTLERDGNTFDGLLAVENARRIQVDCCFFSSTGFSDEDVVNAGMTGSQVKQMMIKNARKVVLLADSTKYGKRGIFKLCRWSDVDILFADSGLAETARTSIRAAGAEVRIAEVGGGAV
jgi:DeoR family transcriptional regulator, fructose operon transcriptional repressor